MSTRSLVLSLILSLALIACGRAETEDVKDAAVDAAEPDAKLVCEAPRTECPSGCTDTRSDPSNCGACGTVCKANEGCNGKCEPACTTSADCPSTKPMCGASRACAVPRDCSQLLAHYRGAPDGVYTIDPDGDGPVEPFAATCDMTTDGGGWTIVAAYSGADGEQPLTSDKVAAGDPFRFQHYNLSIARKVALSVVSNDSLLRTSTSWLKVSAPLFDEMLATPKHRQEPVLVTLRASDSVEGAFTRAYMSYVNFDITGGGDFGIVTDFLLPTCNLTFPTVNGFDQHSALYRNLNCSCERSYLYSHSNASLDSDAGYDVNTGLGAWRATDGCNGADGGALKFYAAMRKVAPSCAAIREASPNLPSGVYTIDPDGPGGASSFSAYCDIAGGGWTLLLSAKASTPYWGNGSANWSSDGAAGTVPTAISLLTDDYKSPAYAQLSTTDIRLCHRDLQHCHVFPHGVRIPLRNFFSEAKVYTEYASQLAGYADVGTADTRAKYLADIGVTEFEGVGCYWLGINQKENQSSLGLMGDNIGGCVTGGSQPEHDVNDLAIGLGLQSCFDGNGCPPGPHPNNVAGHSRRANGKDMSEDLGPWFVFGR